MEGPARIVLLVAIAVWFTASAVCTSAAKMALSGLTQLGAGVTGAAPTSSCALTITTVQFLVAALASSLLAWVQGRRPPDAPRELLMVSLAYTLGFLLLNQSLGRMAASFTETVRGLEPLTSFLLAKVFSARGGRLALASGLSLLTVLVGAAMSVLAQPKFDGRGLAYGLLANCAFSSRALLVTLLQDAASRRSAHVSIVKKGGGAADDIPNNQVDPVGLFAAQHVLGLALLAPVALLTDGTECAHSLLQSEQGWVLRMAEMSAAGFLVYNFLSLYVLLLLDAVTHSVCNTLRRAVTIVSAAIIFQTHISLTSGTGIALIIGGAVCYSVSRSSSAHPGKRLGSSTPPKSSSAKESSEATEALLMHAPDSKPASGEMSDDAA